MLLFIATLGGLLLMMGHQAREKSLFYYFRLEDQVPENHLLRLIDRHVNFEFIRAKLRDRYSDVTTAKVLNGCDLSGCSGNVLSCIAVGRLPFLCTT